MGRPKYRSMGCEPDVIDGRPCDWRARIRCVVLARLISRIVDDDKDAQVDREIARYAVGCAGIRRLMTIPGIDVTTAATLMATIGRIDRFASPRHLVGYLGLDPRSRQSGLGAVQHGHISKQGSATARHVLCEAAHATMRSPGPLRAFGERVRKRRNNKIATVAVARKLACLTWQLPTTEQDYIYERPH